MKVKDVIRDLGSEVRVQLYKATECGYRHLFLRAHSANMLRNCVNDRPWIQINMDKDVDHCEFRTINRGDGFEAFCDIYLKAEPVITESELDAFFKKLDPDAYVHLNIWYGDIDTHADEFIRVELCGADYAHIKKGYKSIVDLFNSLEIASINTDYKDKAIVLDCKRRTTE